MAVAVVSAEFEDDDQAAIRELLRQWFEQASKLWQVTAEVGDRLIAARKKIPPQEWAGWLEPLGLNQYNAFVFMKAARYRAQLEKHKPLSVEAVARLLPQGAGEAFDAEQAKVARELRDGGMSLEAIRLHMHVSKETVRRWVDPDGHAKAAAKKEERRLLRAAAIEDERERRRRAALKAKGGAPALAYNHILAAASALDEAWRAAKDKEHKHALGAALDTLYKAKDKLFTAEGV